MGHIFRSLLTFCDLYGGGTSTMRTALSSAQWALFFLTGGLVAPIVVAAAFHLSDAETAQLIQRTLMIIGISTLLQSLFGHRLPILEGPAGAWWGVFILLAGGLTAGESSALLLRQMEAGLLLVGLFMIALSAFNVIRYVKKLFTPVVTGTYLLLLVFQFSSPIVKGILGVGYRGSVIDPAVAALSLAVLTVTLLLGRSRISWLRHYAVLIGIALGCVLFQAFGLTRWPEAPANGLFERPALFAWGAPAWDTGIALTSLVIALPLLINLIAAITIMEKAIGAKPAGHYAKAGFVMGITQLLSGLFAAVGTVSNSHSAGFVASTGMTRRLPVCIGCLILIAAGLLPVVAALLSTIPVPVALAVIFGSFSHLLSAGLKELGAVLNDEKKLSVVALSLFAGVGSLFIPAASLAALPDVLKPLLSNGLIVGVLAAILIEQGWRLADRYAERQKRKQTERLMAQWAGIGCTSEGCSIPQAKENDHVANG
ncbi:hypothetical protein B1A99_22630 [Cohnella sp. CIP 111063]|nr:hypothetical protein B1A99_22630 [Cohnella sp. CIP 111063]